MTSTTMTFLLFMFIIIIFLSFNPALQSYKWSKIKIIVTGIATIALINIVTFAILG
ncbi:hypothetical protein ACR3I8_17350 [Priestia flexa]